MIMREPAISILLPAYNAEHFLSDALASLAAQTFRDFEVIAIDDGSTDQSLEILTNSKLCYSWLQVYTQPNRGVAEALNHAINKSHGNLLARMDADDITDASRLEKQFLFLQQNPDIDICGTAMRTFGAGKKHNIYYPQSDDAVRARLAFGCPIGHPTVMMRREVFSGEGPFYAGRFEDYDLWLRLAHAARFANLPEVLHSYRIHSDQQTQAPWIKQNAHVWAAQKRFFHKLGLKDTDLDAEAHAMSGIMEPQGLADIPLSRIEHWLSTLQAALMSKKWATPNILAAEFRDAWWRANRRAQTTQNRVGTFLRAPFAGRNWRTLWRAMRLHINTH